jgi:hypothetical protein
MLEETLCTLVVIIIILNILIIMNIIMIIIISSYEMHLDMHDTRWHIYIYIYIVANISQDV